MLAFLVDPQYSASFAVRWDTAPLANRLLTISSMSVPFAFYGYCGLSCFSKFRRWRITLSGVLICVFAAPYFAYLYETLPIVARHSVWTGMCAIPYYLIKPKKGAVAEAEPVDD